MLVLTRSLSGSFSIPGPGPGPANPLVQQRLSIRGHGPRPYCEEYILGFQPGVSFVNKPYISNNFNSNG